MTPMVGFLCVLSALVSTGYSLSCVPCDGKNYRYCKEKPMQCPEGRVCGSVSLRSNGELPNDVIRSCFQKSDCNKSATFTSGGVKTSQIISCCHNGKCTPQTPALHLPADNKTVNGLVCPTCESKKDPSCSSLKEMECTGDESFCFSQSISDGISYTMALRGCASESLCQVGNLSVNLEWRKNLTFYCTKAKSSISRTTTRKPTDNFAFMPRIANRDAGNSTISGNSTGNTGTQSAGSGLHFMLLLEAVVFLMLINPLTLNG